MTRPEWFAVLEKSERLPWKLELSTDGYLCFGAEALSRDSKDTDPDACVFTIWGIAWLKEHGLREVIITNLGNWRLLVRGESGVLEFTSDSLLDAVGNTIAAVLEAQND